MKNKGRILIVDDDYMDRSLLAAVLQEEGYEVKLAEDGGQALETLRRNPCDLVLLDLFMPKLDGFQVLQQMKTASALQHIPVLIISAEEEMNSVIRCLEMGASDYIPKPFPPTLLQARIKNALLTTGCFQMNSNDGHAEMLVVDDDFMNRTLLAAGLKDKGYTVTMAENGRQALDILRKQSFDIVFLDLLMPEMNGFETLEQMKADSALQHIPVIVVSAEEEMESVVRCIEIGATDHLPKPFDPIMLHARVNASLAMKHLHDRELAHLKLIQAERHKSERLLLNILPKTVADRLKHGEEIIADYFQDVSILFADIVGFTKFSSQVSPTTLVTLLNDTFSRFDRLAAEKGLEKIKTIGDAYMLVGGLPRPRPDHTEAVADMALDMQHAIVRINQEHGQTLRLRVGIHCGPVVAGVIGAQKFSYDLWGDTVNIASRMESHGIDGGIQVTETIYERLKDTHLFEEHGVIPFKGKDDINTYLLTGRQT